MNNSSRKMQYNRTICYEIIEEKWDSYSKFQMSGVLCLKANHKQDERTAMDRFSDASSRGWFLDWTVTGFDCATISWSSSTSVVANDLWGLTYD